ncbi:tRNA adenosine(34) deaminase TadA [Psychrobacter sp. AOP22-C1-22]|uniref:tRNA adenosine(34) deaminase TadA n=1 Tax=unclassified Psychrobacter TaxID=196806 RepID=UPI001788265E|nr:MULTISPECIES: tRNA adenosine(34) deaminase TadA [unclassified Psychrobacter]MBE0405408.1 tRNA adenosine(34) deaminase TadA [Psychrobacter sp. FME6]MBE0444312.1 tRNA adenosine(34) deaminase TadA [Psychrobacter sp. FME5]MDN5801765.1 tRNA adenosine(34) deaminase TadA [Psychrobacter sp.]MDN5890613.1 tRNA adenosine(34) deaminase TadA [Psychrobacter sp.]
MINSLHHQLPPYYLSDSLSIDGTFISEQLKTSTFWSVDDVKWMQQALKLAKKGAKYGEVPVGAILVHQQQVIGQGFNEPIGRHDATAHAEIVALRDACARLKNYRLPLQTTLYVTLEPCTMCIGALIHARVDRLIYAASEPRAGMVGSQLNLPEQPFYNHTIEVHKGLCGEHSSQMLRTFFRERRKVAKNKASMPH